MNKYIHITPVLILIVMEERIGSYFAHMVEIANEFVLILIVMEERIGSRVLCLS